MEFVEILLGILIAYAVGSIPTSILISKFHFGIDIREHGNGEASHLNIYEVLGKRISWIVRLLDVAKGYFAVGLYCFLQSHWSMYGESHIEIMRMSFALAAIMGHIFPLWAGFKGGKGVHVSIGVLLVLAPQASLFCILIGLAVWFFTQHQNFAYIIGSAAFPIFIIFAGPLVSEYYYAMVVFSFLLFIFLFATHWKSLEEVRRVEKFDGSSVR